MNQNTPEFNDKLLGLLKAIVGIIVAFFIIFLFAYLLPVILRIMDEPEIQSLGESFLEVTEGMGIVLGEIVWLLFGVLAIVLAVCFVAVFLPAILKIFPWKQIRNGDAAIDTLRIRYAKGELTKEQYVEMKKTLEEL
ncbi:SHOCT domain-containing protein [[Eubacterium] cellulosolvens]